MEKDKRIFKTGIARLSKKREEIDETAHLKKYIMWENKSNICWLDASLALIAHNKVMRRAAQVSPNSAISRIIARYAEAISILNRESSLSLLDNLNIAKSELHCVQESTLHYLQPILKYKPGDPDSAFCSLYNLLKQDPIIKGIFDVTWVSIKKCTSCNYHAENTKTKPLITLSRINSFDPKSPAVIYNCNCGKLEQEIKFVFVTLPPCLIFHFENGAGQEIPPLSFVTQERHYFLTAITTLEKGQESNVNHFITWIRDPFSDKWLDCNDLNPDPIYFTPNFPDIRFEDVSFYVYESFDDLGTIRDYKVAKVKNSDEEIVCIDISEEENSSSVSNASGADINVKKNEDPSTETQVTSFSTESNLSKSEREILAENKEHVPDKKIIQPDSAEISETPCIEVKDSKNNKSSSESSRKTPSDQSMDCNIQNETTVDSELHDLRVCDNKFNENASEKVIQHDCDDKSIFEVCELKNQINTCFSQEQVYEEDTVSPHEKEMLENTVAIEKQNCIEDKEDDQNNALLQPVKELDISDIRDESYEDITKADIAKSGTSYVKLSFRRKKNPGLTFLRQNSVKSENNPASSDSKTISVRKCPKSVKENKALKRNKDEEWNTVPLKKPRKNQKSEQTLKGLQSNAKKENIIHSMHYKDLGLSIQDKSKLKNVVDEKKIQQKHKISHSTSKDNESHRKYNYSDTNQQTYSNMLSATETSNENNHEVKILKEFEDVWSSHEPGCNCELTNLEETVDTVVDYTFAYLCKLSQEIKKNKSY